jgi:hypothetical protein
MFTVRDLHVALTGCYNEISVNCRLKLHHYSLEICVLRGQHVQQLCKR